MKISTPYLVIISQERSIGEGRTNVLKQQSYFLEALDLLFSEKLLRDFPPLRKTLLLEFSFKFDSFIESKLSDCINQYILQTYM